ncbi:uncharacterized protein [Clytia hemisphaerica]|uniref:uncharacterized protein n=1 Tax=Clytia hemisphaerica TaxID=252671 RepID=UPI0034D74936
MYGSAVAIGLRIASTSQGRVRKEEVKKQARRSLKKRLLDDYDDEEQDGKVSSEKGQEIEDGWMDKDEDGDEASFVNKSIPCDSALAGDFPSIELTHEDNDDYDGDDDDDNDDDKDNDDDVNDPDFIPNDSAETSDEEEEQDKDFEVTSTPLQKSQSPRNSNEATQIFSFHNDSLSDKTNQPYIPDETNPTHSNKLNNSADHQIFVKSTSHKNEKLVCDKKYYCPLCPTKKFVKLYRHYEDSHPETKEGKHLKAHQYEKGDSTATKAYKKAERERVIEPLRRRANYIHNLHVLETKKGELIVKRCPVKETDYSMYLPCEFCLQFFYKNDLFRHITNCPLNNKNNLPSRVQTKARLLLPLRNEASLELNKILVRMRSDDVGNLVKYDPAIIKYGNTLCRKHLNNEDQEYHISNKLRELGRFVIGMRKELSQPKAWLFELLNPQIFSSVLSCVRKMCGWNEENKTVETPSLGIKLGQLLVKIAYMVKGEALMQGDNDQKTKTDDFVCLIEMKWNEEISRVSRTELQVRKYNKPQLLPLTEDLMKLKTHLVTTRQTSFDKLAADNSNISAWRSLATSTLASIILLNRRRSGEVAKMKSDQFGDHATGNLHGEVKKSLSPFEVKLCATLKRIEIRGKRGRKVPVLLTKQMTESMDILEKTREDVGVLPDNRYFFAVPTSLSYLRGPDALRKHANLCDLQCPEAVTSTKLRKHIATLCQILNLQERELEILAGFLGHDVKIHREYYRLPESTTQVAKVGKLLMLMERGEVGDFAGQTLDNIEMDLNEINSECESDVDSTDESDQSEDEELNENNEDGTTTRRTTSREGIAKDKKLIVEQSECLQEFLLTFSTPGKVDCEKCIKDANGALDEYNWEQIKWYAIKLEFSRKKYINEYILDSNSENSNDFEKLIHAKHAEYVEELMLKISSQKLELCGRYLC